MSSSSYSSSDEDQAPSKQKKNSFIVKKPSFLKRARTLPYELRLLKQQQDDRRKGIVQRQQDDIHIHLSVIEMELAHLNELLDVDVAKAIRRELALEHSIIPLCERKLPVIKDKICFEPSMPSLDYSDQELESNSEWEENTKFKTVGKYEEVYVQSNVVIDTSSSFSVPSTSTDIQSLLAVTEKQRSLLKNSQNAPKQQSLLKVNQSSNKQQSLLKSSLTNTRESSPDIEIIEVIEEVEEEVKEEDEDEDDEVMIVQEIDRRKINKTAYQQYQDLQEEWNNRVLEIKEKLLPKYQTQHENTSSWRIENFKILTNYIREIADLLERRNILKSDSHYAQLQARVDLTKLIEVCGFNLFNHLDAKSILILKQADKELANFQYEYWKAKMKSME